VDEGDGLSLEEAIEQSAAELAAELPAGTRVVIAAFASEHENLSNYIMDELTGALVDGSLEVADRRNLPFVYRELGFQMSGDVSDETAVSIGKFLAASHVITGQLVDAGSGRRYRLSGVNVETAVQESSTRLSVRDDRALRNLIAAVGRAPLVTAAAAFGDSGTVRPKTAGAFLDRGILFATRGDFEMAIEEFTEALTLDGSLAAAYLLRGRAYIASVSRVTGIGENFSSFDFISEDAGTAGQGEVLNKAIADYTQAIKLDPNLRAAYHERGGAYAGKGMYDRAIEDYNVAIRLDPNDAYAYAYNNRGIAYGNKGMYDRAIEDHTAALRIDPDYADAYNNRGLAYRNKGMYDRAIEDYNAALRIKADYALVYYNRGLAYYYKGMYDRAIEDYTAALRIDPNFANAYINRGVAYKNREMYDRAIEDYTAALRINPNDAGAYNNRGKTYYGKGMYDRAIEDFTAALRINPNDADAYYSRGLVYYYKNDYRRARADWEKTLQLDPNNAGARNNLEFLRDMGY
jgi:tetratricopeptide (TPR) repeat protein